jgi:hypothetical protein
MNTVINSTLLDVICTQKYFHKYIILLQVLAHKRVRTRFFCQNIGRAKRSEKPPGTNRRTVRPQGSGGIGKQRLPRVLSSGVERLPRDRGLCPRPSGIYRFPPVAWQTPEAGRIRGPASSRPQGRLCLLTSCHWPKASNAGGLGAEPPIGRHHAGDEYGVPRSPLFVGRLTCARVFGILKRVACSSLAYGNRRRIQFTPS